MKGTASGNSTGLNYNTYILGSGVGNVSASNRFALKRRASTSSGCCNTDITFTVMYDGNTNSTGDAPIDTLSPYLRGSIVTVLANTETIEKPNYFFSGWNLAANGSGTTYQPGDKFHLTSKVTLYAKWTIMKYTVTYVSDLNTGGVVPAASSYDFGSTVTVSGNTGTLVRTRYNFDGWLDGETPYAVASTFTLTSDITLNAKWTIITYTVTYVSVLHNGGVVPGSATYNIDSIVTVSGNTGTLVRTGYIFIGWTYGNTTYAEGDLFTIISNVTLYANWTSLAILSVTYLSTNSDGQSPYDDSFYAPNSIVTVLGNIGLGWTPVLSKNGYLFAGWNTLDDGSGLSYVGGDSLVINSNITLYAQWLVGGVRLIYNPGTVGQGTAPASSGTAYSGFSTQTIAQNTFTNGMFAGWNTELNGSGTSYSPGNSIIIPGSGTVNLYAQWINLNLNYTVSYNAGTDGVGIDPAVTITYSEKSEVTVLGNNGPYVSVNPTKVFLRWNTALNGSGTNYEPGSTFNILGTTTLYAQWVTSSGQNSLTYNANGASGTLPGPTFYPAQSPPSVEVPISGQGALRRYGFVFLGWNNSAIGNGTWYAPGYTILLSTSVTLYAQWVPGSVIKSCDTLTASGGSGTVIVTYLFPYAKIIQNLNTITIFSTALIGRTTTTYGTGVFTPFGIRSIANRTVITQSTIESFTNTSYNTTAYNVNRLKTITNGVQSTYWPFGATLSNITFASQNITNSAGIPTYSISTTNNVNGCGLGASSDTSGSTTTIHTFLTQSLTLNYSDGNSTTIFDSPNNAFYTTNNAGSWRIDIPRSIFPYYGPTNYPDEALNTITIRPSNGPEYVNPSLPNYTIEYNGNGNTGGILPSPQYLAPYSVGSSVLLRNLTSTSVPLSKTGFTFSGWNTAASGLGTNYATGATYNGLASITLYAKWV